MVVCKNCGKEIGLYTEHYLGITVKQQNENNDGKPFVLEINRWKDVSKRGGWLDDYTPVWKDRANLICPHCSKSPFILSETKESKREWFLKEKERSERLAKIRKERIERECERNGKAEND